MKRFIKSIIIFYLIFHLGQLQSTTNSKYNKLNFAASSNDSTALIKSFTSTTNLVCLGECTKNADCSYVNYANKICRLYTPLINRYFVHSSTEIFYEKDRKNPNFVKTNGLMNYWSFYGNEKDLIGIANLYNGVNTVWTNDKNNKLHSALRINTGYYKAPSGNYFNGDFSILAWVKIRTYGSNSRLIDFSPTGSSSCDISFVLSDLTSGFFKVVVRDSNSNYQTTGVSSRALMKNTWEHVACSLDGTSMTLYLNGTFQASYSSKLPCITSYQSNFIGGTNFASDSLNADIDELKIFNRALTEAEIQLEMSNNLYL